MVSKFETNQINEEIRSNAIFDISNAKKPSTLRKIRSYNSNKCKLSSKVVKNNIIAALKNDMAIGVLANKIDRRKIENKLRGLLNGLLMENVIILWDHEGHHGCDCETSCWVCEYGYCSHYGHHRHHRCHGHCGCSCDCCCFSCSKCNCHDCCCSLEREILFNKPNQIMVEFDKLNPLYKTKINDFDQDKSDKLCYGCSHHGHHEHHKHHRHCGCNCDCFSCDCFSNSVDCCCSFEKEKKCVPKKFNETNQIKGEETDQKTMLDELIDEKINELDTINASYKSKINEFDKDKPEKLIEIIADKKDTINVSSMENDKEISIYSCESCESCTIS